MACRGCGVEIEAWRASEYAGGIGESIGGVTVGASSGAIASGAIEYSAIEGTGGSSVGGNIPTLTIVTETTSETSLAILYATDHFTCFTIC